MAISKKTINSFLLAAFCSFATVSCSTDIDELFDSSAAQRVQKSVEYYDQLLQDAPYGWIMNYYPGDGSMGGCAFTVKFDKGNVEMTSEIQISDTIEVGTPYTSKYRVLKEQSIILTFDTYNPLLHSFTEPSQSNIDGWHSDYEFIFNRVSEHSDSIFLTGKKYGMELVLRRMTKEDQNYIQNVTRMNRLLMSVPHFYAVAGDKQYNIRLDDLRFTYPSEDGQSTITSVFTYTPEGIEFKEPVTLGGIMFTNMVYDEPTGELSSPDGKVRILFPSNMQQFANTLGQWKFIIDAAAQKGECDKTFISSFYRPIAFLCTIENCFIGYNSVYPDSDENEYVIGFQYNVFDQYLLYGCYGIKINPIGDDSVEIIGVDKAYGYNEYYFSPITSRILKGSPYRIEFQEGNIQRKIKLVSIQDENIWFYLSNQ